MLTIFAEELNTTGSELDALLAKVDTLRLQMKKLKAAQNKALKVMERLKNLVSELPELALAELKTEILSLFPCYQAETKESVAVAEQFTNFVNEVPKTEEAQPWNPADFEPLEYQAEDNGQFNLLQPTTTEPPEPDDFLTADNVIDLSAYREAWEQWEKTNRPVKADFGVNDFGVSAAVELVETQSNATASETTSDDDDQWPEVEPVIPAVEPPKENDFATNEYLNNTVMFIKKHSGEILAGYIACMNRGLASDWAFCLNLWGCNAEFRKAKRFGKGIQWEVKIIKISMEQLITVANNHPGLYSSVPAGNQENAKKFLSGKARKDSESTENLMEIYLRCNLICVILSLNQIVIAINQQNRFDFAALSLLLTILQKPLATLTHPARPPRNILIPSKLVLMRL